MENKATTKKQTRRVLTGEVVSNKMAKTVVVRVDRTVVHPKYGKRYVRSAKYHAHDKNNACQVGDQVTLIETRPYSATKRWQVVTKSEKSVE